MAKILTWDGYSLPAALRELPAGQHVLEPVGEAPPLSAEDEAGLDAAIASLRRGEGLGPKEARRRVSAILKR